MDRIGKIIRRGNILLGYCSGFLILTMGLSLFYEVICRYVLRSPSLWTHETAVYLYTWAMLAAGAYTLQAEKHVRIELFVDCLSPKVQALVRVITSVGGALFCLLVTVQAFDMIKLSIRYSKVSPTLLKVPLWIPQGALLVGFLLLTLQFLLIAMMQLRDRGKERIERC